MGKPYNEIDFRVGGLDINVLLHPSIPSIPPPIPQMDSALIVAFAHHHHR